MRTIDKVATQATIDKAATQATIDKAATQATIDKVATQATIDKAATQATIDKAATQATTWCRSPCRSGSSPHHVGPGTQSLQLAAHPPAASPSSTAARQRPLHAPLHPDRGPPADVQNGVKAIGNAFLCPSVCLC